MLNELILNPITGRQLANFVAHPSHALLVCGPEGMGKTAISRALCMQILQLDGHRFANYPYARLIAPDDKGTISINVIRELQHFLQLKTTGSAAIRRIAVIEHAQTMTTEAQNAFLKILEEPPADTLIILTAANLRALLPTIHSRVQTITVREPSQTQLTTYFEAQGKDEKAIAQAFLLSGGLPGLMSAILDGQNEHPLVVGIAQAKKILASSTFERLAAVDALSRQKDDVPTLLNALVCIAQAAQTQATAQKDKRKLKQWHRVRKQTQAAQASLKNNISAKLVLTNLMLQV